jgi:hypothetical protein
MPVSIKIQMTSHPGESEGVRAPQEAAGSRSFFSGPSDEVIFELTENVKTEYGSLMPLGGIDFNLVTDSESNQEVVSVATGPQKGRSDQWAWSLNFRRGDEAGTKKDILSSQVLK